MFLQQFWWSIIFTPLTTLATSIFRQVLPLKVCFLVLAYWLMMYNLVTHEDFQSEIGQYVKKIPKIFFLIILPSKMRHCGVFLVLFHILAYFSLKILMCYQIIHHRHTFSGKTCLKMDVASIVKGVKMIDHQNFGLDLPIMRTIDYIIFLLNSVTREGG